MQSLLFTTADVFVAKYMYTYSDYNPDATWSTTCVNLASFFFMLQHALFVGQYARVAISIPLTFCYQSEEVKAKLRKRMCIILGCEIGMALYLAAQFCIVICGKGSFLFFWTLPSVLLAIVLGLAF